MAHGTGGQYWTQNEQNSNKICLFCFFKIIFITIEERKNKNGKMIKKKENNVGLGEGNG